MKFSRLAFRLALAAALGQAGAAAVAAPPPQGETAARVADARTLEAARRLAKLVNPEQAQVDATLRMVDNSFIPAMSADEDVKAMEAEYPGLLRRIADDLKPVFIRHTRRILPAHIERYAEVYAANFSAEELDELYELYASPAGQRLVASMLENVSADSLLQEVVKDPDAPTSLAAVKADHDRARRAALKQVSDADKDAFAALIAKPYLSRMMALGPKLRKLEQELINEPDPALDAEIEQVIEKSITDFIAAADVGK